MSPTLTPPGDRHAPFAAVGDPRAERATGLGDLERVECHDPEALGEQLSPIARGRRHDARRVHAALQDTIRDRIDG